MLKIEGRHDPCIVPRAVVVVEAVSAIAIADLMRRGGYIATTR
ncbi:MAG TPA: chorismate synthase [Methanomassiliicoccales archaeon]|nr:chorismate synthase [Methanomassiliicoccales archaeon]